MIQVGGRAHINLLFGLSLATHLPFHVVLLLNATVGDAEAALIEFFLGWSLWRRSTLRHATTIASRVGSASLIAVAVVSRNESAVATAAAPIAILW